MIASKLLSVVGFWSSHREGQLFCCPSLPLTAREELKYMEKLTLLLLYQSSKVARHMIKSSTKYGKTTTNNMNSHSKWATVKIVLALAGLVGAMIVSEHSASVQCQCT